MSNYQKFIKEDLVKMGHGENYDPRHIEAYIRLQHSTLDGLSPRQFRNEIEIAVECIKIDGLENAEACAKSFGL